MLCKSASSKTSKMDQERGCGPGGILSKSTNGCNMTLTCFPYPWAVADIIQCHHILKLEEIWLPPYPPHLRIQFYQLKWERTSTKGSGEEGSRARSVKPLDPLICFWLLYQYAMVSLRLTSQSLVSGFTSSGNTGNAYQNQIAIIFGLLFFHSFI